MKFPPQKLGISMKRYPFPWNDEFCSGVFNRKANKNNHVVETWDYREEKSNFWRTYLTFFCSEPKRRQTSLHRAPKPKSERKKTKLWIEGENKVTKTDIIHKIYIYIYRQYAWYIYTMCMCILHVCVCVQPTYDDPSTFPPTSIPYPIRKKRRKNKLRNQWELYRYPM